MNAYFLPTSEEEAIIELIQQYCRSEFALIRMTETMLDKSIIDASDTIRILLNDSEIIDYNELNQGDKVMKAATILTDSHIIEEETSFYRPKTKDGDPRFWIYRFKRYVAAGTLVYFTIFDKQVTAIPVVKTPEFEPLLERLFGPLDDGQEHIQALARLLQKINGQWIKSVSPDKSDPRDIGETLEKALGLSINNLESADFRGEIEIKAKKMGGKTKDTLFSKVPDWVISPIGSAANMIIKYGYPIEDDSKYNGYMSLFVTVKNIPNKQKLFMEDDPANEHMLQVHSEDGTVCRWHYKTLKDALYKKHPKTVWVVAKQERIDGALHFLYDIDEIQLTERPIFTQFTSLINQGIVTYDWRGRVMPDATKYRDHGHCFRIAPKERHRIFGATRKLAREQ